MLHSFHHPKSETVVMFLELFLLKADNFLVQVDHKVSDEVLVLTHESNQIESIRFGDSQFGNQISLRDVIVDLAQSFGSVDQDYRFELLDQFPGSILNEPLLLPLDKLSELRPESSDDHFG
jgi:hypothetical protein